MKKYFFIVASAALLAACNGRQNQMEGSASQMREDSLKEVINQTNNELNEVMNTFNEIQEGFQRINEAQGRVDIQKRTAEKGTSVQQIKEDMALISESMEQNERLIAELKAKVRNSAVNNEKMRKNIEGLTTQLQQYKAQIEQLTAELESKNIIIEEQGKHIETLATNVSELSADNSQKAAKIETQDKELNSGWFVFGTKSELKEQKILKDGEVLRSSEFNRDYFTKVDIRNVHSIKLYSKNAKLLTSHPAGTYALEKDEKGQYVLRITYPKQFWSASKYLVLLVK